MAKNKNGSYTADGITRRKFKFIQATKKANRMKNLAGCRNRNT